MAQAVRVLRCAKIGVVSLRAECCFLHIERADDGGSRSAQLCNDLCVSLGNAAIHAQTAIPLKVASKKIDYGVEVTDRTKPRRHIALALIPAMAAREVAVSALATVYAIDDGNEARRDLSLGERMKGAWSLPTALAFLAWFVFAPQCISTIAVVRRETNGWKWPAFMVGYLFALAYVAAGITFWVATYLGL